MIEVNKETFAGIECLHASPAGQRRSPLPTILFSMVLRRRKTFIPGLVWRWRWLDFA